MIIRLLSQNLINQIAAGEVVERPSSVVKELTENAIDAGATEVEVRIADAGKSFISVSDNGCGMDKQSLEMCVLSHATSKLTADNLFDIHTFGFRGEALPSIASISRISISTCDSTDAWNLQLEGGQVTSMAPCNRKQGTTVEVRDLFFATPARLKFLKSDSTEAENCLSMFNRIALAFPRVTFSFYDSDKCKAHYEKTDDLQKRICDVFGTPFSENLFSVSAQKDELKLQGFVGVPTFNKASAGYQYFFVNNRCVKDKFFSSALKSAYAGLVPQGRYAAAVVYLDMPYNAVDVNAHPAKTEIRFKDADKVRYFIMSELKKALLSFGALKPTTESVNSFCPSEITKADSYTPSYASLRPQKDVYKEYKFFFPQNKTEQDDKEFPRYIPTPKNEPESPTIPMSFSEVEENKDETFISLGEALYQINNTYIVSATEDTLFVTDQHAAAERITLEKLKNNDLDSQTLLLPEVCAFSAAQVELLVSSVELLLKFGIHFEKLADDLVNVTAIPAILGTCDVSALITDIVDELESFGDAYTLNDKINHIVSTISCHGSLRAGKALSTTEMNSLLRQMEHTSNIAQCCHGRPSYVSFSVKDLNKFFERS
ncbi:MAG: DNA mismatch repair endonuclease MutL [Alphaproteobacteria bacterium]|nr:DNA mismatch repair endonuclease MutL [Alphaproteobacteria bacterium]